MIHKKNWTVIWNRSSTNNWYLNG